MHGQTKIPVVFNNQQNIYIYIYNCTV